MFTSVGDHNLGTGFTVGLLSDTTTKLVRVSKRRLREF